MRHIDQILKEAYFSFICLFVIQKTVIRDESVLSGSGINQAQSESSQPLSTAVPKIDVYTFFLYFVF